MTRADEEEGGEDHQRPVEVEPDDIIGWMRKEERVAGQQRPCRCVVLVPQTDTSQSIQDRRLVQNRLESAFEEPHDNDIPMQEVPDSHDLRLGRVRRRLRLLWNPETDLAPEVRVAANLLRSLATRIGAVPHGSVLPGAIRRQRWSPFNVPLMWAAAAQAETCPVFAWLISIAGRVDEPVPFFGGNMSASGAVRTGWAKLRHSMRSWCVNSDAELSGWLSRSGFPAAQEFILTMACREDACVGLLEAVFVEMTLNEGCRQTSDAEAVPLIPRASVGGTAIPTSVPRDSWEQLDDVDLEEVFLRRTPMLRSCPHFSRGRVRHCTLEGQVGGRHRRRRTCVESVCPHPIDDSSPTQGCRQRRETRVAGTR